VHEIDILRVGREKRGAGEADAHEKTPRAPALGIAPPGLDPEALARAPKDETTQKKAALSAAVLPLLGSNQDSPDPEGPL
jgi:hypothetical protein